MSESLTDSKEFKELLEMIPETERPKVLEGLVALEKEFKEKVLKPIESAVNTQKAESD
jgi:hypothetical protein